jgi:hypothetical protein
MVFLLSWSKQGLIAITEHEATVAALTVATQICTCAAFCVYGRIIAQPFVSE